MPLSKQQVLYWPISWGKEIHFLFLKRSFVLLLSIDASPPLPHFLMWVSWSRWLENRTILQGGYYLGNCPSTSGYQVVEKQHRLGTSLKSTSLSTTSKHYFDTATRPKNGSQKGWVAIAHSGASKPTTVWQLVGANCPHQDRQEMMVWWAKHSDIPGRKEKHLLYQMASSYRSVCQGRNLPSAKELEKFRSTQPRNIEPTAETRDKELRFRG